MDEECAIDEIDSSAKNRQGRAYVSVSTAAIHGLDGEGIPTAKIGVRNFGQTPAKGAVHATTIGLRDFPLKVELTPTNASDSTGRQDLPPGGEIDIIQPYTRTLTLEEKAALAAGSKAIFVWGQIRYRDTFNRERSTRFCFFKGGGFGVDGPQVAACERGNEAT